MKKDSAHLASTLSGDPDQTKDRGIEVRLNTDDSLDEVVGQNCSVHVEQMSATHWWMAIERNGQSCHINFHSKGKITANYSDEGERTFQIKRPEIKL